MTFPPIVERELRVTARRPGFYWLRALLALIAGLKGYELLGSYNSKFVPTGLVTSAGAAMPTMPALTGADLLHELTWLVFVAALLMSLLSADSISRERRDGTLGLLLLTSLTPRQIVRGKMLSCGLTSFAMLLGLLPALMMTVLAGGVSGAEAVMTGLGLLTDLFVALAVGLWMSALFRERLHAMIATLGMIAVLAIGAEGFGGSALGGGGAENLLRLLGLAGWMVPARGSLLLSPLFIVWFALTAGLGWFFMHQAGQTLAANWQDKPSKQVREPEPFEERPGTPPVIADRWGVAPARESWLTDPRPWDADPVRWRMERLGTAEGLTWCGVLLGFFAQFGVLSSGSSRSDFWGALAVGGMLGMLGSGAMLAWAGARFFQHTRRQQDLELLLTTPIGGRDILTSQWRVLRRALTPPLGMVLFLALPAGLALVYAWFARSGSEFWFFLSPFLISVNLAVETLALCWMGMQFGLHARNVATALCWTVGVVQLAPLVMALGIVWSWPMLANGSSFVKSHLGKMPPEVPAVLFLLAKNAALIAWARFSLRRGLRLGGRWSSRLTPEFA